MGMSDTKRTIGWMMVTLGLLFFILKTPLPFDIVTPGVTSTLLGIVILLVGSRRRRTY